MPQQSAECEYSSDVNPDSVTFLTEMIALVPAVIYVFNHQTMSNEYSNRSVGELLGYGPDEIKAMGEDLLPKIVHPDDFDALAAHVGSLQNLPTGEQSVWDYRAIRSDGRVVWLRSIEVVFARSVDGSVLRHLGVAFDITADKEKLLGMTAEITESKAAPRSGSKLPSPGECA